MEQTFSFEIENQIIKCDVNEYNLEDGTVSYTVTIIYPDGEEVAEIMRLDEDSQQLEFIICNTPYRDEHFEVERMLAEKINNQNL